MDLKLVQLQSHGDTRGSLVALEEGKNVPFKIKRIYYMFDTKLGVERGFHAHKTLKQIVVAVKGSCQLRLDNGSEKAEVRLENPNQGVIIDSFLWREIYDFSSDCVLMVIADSLYDESDYIRDYNYFLELTQSDS